MPVPVHHFQAFGTKHALHLKAAAARVLLRLFSHTYNTLRLSFYVTRSNGSHLFGRVKRDEGDTLLGPHDNAS